MMHGIKLALEIQVNVFFAVTGIALLNRKRKGINAKLASLG